MEAAHASQSTLAPIVAADAASDYGSDLELDESTVADLFAPSGIRTTVEPPVILDDHGDTRQPLLRFARIRDNLAQAITGLNATCEALSKQGAEARAAAVEIEYDESNRGAFAPVRTEEERAQFQRDRETSAAPESQREPDTRSPLLRFRTPPKKTLSVTDIISPAWCELQYWYSLTRYGRIRRTPAMKQGSTVHKVLEEQVHTEVPIEVVSKEDRFALRLWNVIQGLRTMRRTGMTREMEVWGVIEGEVVNGIVDQITTECPDEPMEAKMLEKAEGAPKKGQKPLPADQRTLTDYLKLSQSASVLEAPNSSAWLSPILKPQTLYIVDVKTRKSLSLPEATSSQFRSTRMQLQLYRQLFSALASNTVPAQQIFDRYAVDASATFSDTFIAQMSSLDIAFSPTEIEGEVDDRGPTDSIDELLAHKTLTTLWTLMISEFALTVPSIDSISPLLTAEYRGSASGKLLGRTSFAFDSVGLDAYVQDELKWWRGERPAKGVEIEEAFKCGFCEFAEVCEWRKTKVEEGIQKARLRKEKRRRSEV